jgi:hypothetical protein
MFFRIPLDWDFFDVFLVGMVDNSGAIRFIFWG